MAQFLFSEVLSNLDPITASATRDERIRAALKTSVQTPWQLRLTDGWLTVKQPFPSGQLS